MTTSVQSITYNVSEDSDQISLLRIEQEAWPNTTGIITKQEMIRMVSSSLIGSDYEPSIDCGVADGKLVCTVYAYPLVAGLIYQLYASWGDLEGPTVDMFETAELVQFRLTDEETPEYPPRKILSVSWADECCGPDGEFVPPPELTIDGESILSSATVYGTAVVRYLCERHTYALTAPRRETSFSDNFGSVLVGAYQGGLVRLNINMPPGIEAFNADADATCGASWGGSASLSNDDDNQDIPTASPASRTTVINYCAQQVESDTYA